MVCISGPGFPVVRTITYAHTRGVIKRALGDAKHNKSLAAKKLGLSRKQLYVRLRQHGLA